MTLLESCSTFGKNVRLICRKKMREREHLSSKAKAKQITQPGMLKLVDIVFTSNKAKVYLRFDLI